MKAPMDFKHATTAFALNGQHKKGACTSCHTNLVFAGTPRSCFSCHKKDFDGAVTMNHRVAGFSTDCQNCHTDKATSWEAGFNHNTTAFPTRGAHDGVPCLSCHVGGKYHGTPIACVSCHRKEYGATTTPSHTTAHFGTDCGTCHRALTWRPAAFFPHNYFPITKGSGHPPGRWSSCLDCHPQQPNYSPATLNCTNCHAHSESSMASRHARASGYQWDSRKCVSCHPAG
jgi:hypothetical protein